MGGDGICRAPRSLSLGSEALQQMWRMGYDGQLEWKGKLRAANLKPVSSTWQRSPALLNDINFNLIVG
jgi:hypothetical protein